MRNAIDPVRLELIKNGFETIADEMALILMRTAYSPIVRDAMDFSTAICDAQGRTLAQGLTTPLHLGSFHDAMAFLIKRFGAELKPGDIFIGNDPYIAAGQHLPDIYIVRPIFMEQRLVGFATALAHHVDVGGIIPGSNSLGAHEIYQEGLRLPFLKLYDAGVPNEAIMQIVEANVRTPTLVLGDLEAQSVSTVVAERSFQALCRQHGTDRLEVYVEALHDYAETLARREISEIRDGRYRFEDEIDGLGEHPQPVRFKVEVEIAGDEVVVDWTGTSDQVKGGINSPIAFTKAAAYAALRSVMGSDVPNCGGFIRPITVRAPEGSILNPRVPAACGARGITGFRMMDCLMGALAQAAPDRVAADGSGGASLPTFAGRRNGEAFVFSETLMGNWGGNVRHDGQEGVAHMGANQSNVPIELIELDYPLRIERYEIVADTGGPGRHRGGLAIRRDYRILADDVLVSIRSDKRAFPPHGLAGGAAGAPSQTFVNPGEDDEREVPVLTTEPLMLKKGDLFSHRLAGAGGHGDPFERDPQAVLADVVAEKVTRQRAAADYGVAIDAASPAVDWERTEALRQARRPSAAA